MRVDKDFPAGLRAAILIPWSSFKETPLHFFAKSLTEMRIALKVATRYAYDNSDCRVVDARGSEFAFSISTEKMSLESPLWRQARAKYGNAFHGGPGDSNLRTLHLWNSRGCQAIYEAEFLAEWSDLIPEEVLAGASAAMAAYHHNRVACSDCGAGTPSNEGRTYFAGTYCPACWEGSTGQYAGKGGWKEVEAKETYE